MNMNEYAALQIHKQREQEIEAERQHQVWVKDAKAQKIAWLGLIPYKLRK